MNPRLFPLSLVGLSFLVTSQSSAQQQAARRGLWGSAIVGYGAATAGCRAPCPGLGRTLGQSIVARIGGTTRPNLLLGAEISGWFQHAKDQDDIAHGSFIAVFYPSSNRGLFVNAGIGLSTYLRDTDAYEGTGAGVSIGIGHDFPWTDKMSLTVAASVLLGYVGRVSGGGTTYANNWRQMALIVGGGVTIL